jgi:hypothetical protein
MQKQNVAQKSILPEKKQDDQTEKVAVDQK